MNDTLLEIYSKDFVETIRENESKEFLHCETDKEWISTSERTQGAWKWERANRIRSFDRNQPWAEKGLLGHVY